LAMECPQCKGINPDNKNYCGDCGAELNAINALSEPDLRTRIQQTGAAGNEWADDDRPSTKSRPAVRFPI
jgi:hypothetical protein